MHAVVVEAVPAVAIHAAAEACEERLAVVTDHVVLAGDVEHLAGPCLFQQFGHGVELLGLGQVRQVAGMHHEIGSLRLRVDQCDRLAQAGDRIGVGRLVEADMAVADLHEAEGGVLRRGVLEQRAGVRDAAMHQPQRAGAGPGHALEEAPPVRLHVVAIVFHGNASSLEMDSKTCALRVLQDVIPLRLRAYSRLRAPGINSPGHQSRLDGRWNKRAGAD